MKNSTLKIISLIIVFAIISSVFCLPNGVSAISVDGVSLNSIDDIRQSFESYYVPKDQQIEYTDNQGNPYFTTVDPALTWTAQNGVLTRYGSGNYSGGSGRKGAALLYYKKALTDFQVEFDYSMKGCSSWRWMALGFGASEIGANFTNDGYMAVVEQEGTMRLFDASVSAPYISSTKVTAYTEAIAEQWIHANISVINGKLCVVVTYADAEGNEAEISCEKGLSDYNGGYIYLHSSTQNMQIKNLYITDLKSDEEYDPTLSTEYYFGDISEVGEAFSCYTYKTIYDYGDTNINGDPLYELVDPSVAWQVDAKTKGLIRKGTSRYTGGSGTKGASMLFTNEQYTDFEIEFEYCFSENNGSWRWAGVGFGADAKGDSYPNDSYFAVVEKEGTVRLHMKGENEPTGINAGANDTYNKQVNTNVSDNISTWHNMRVSLVNGFFSLSYDGNGPFTKSGLSITDPGYVYIYSNTEGMKIRNLRISTPLTGDTVHNIEIWPEEYETSSEKIGAIGNVSCTDTAFSFETTVSGKVLPLYITFPSVGGIRLSGEKKGFFEPSGNKKITFNKVSSGYEIVADGEKALLEADNSSWRLITYKNGKSSVCVDSSKILFGYKTDGTLGRIKYTFPISSGEFFYGLGERFNAVNQNGYTVTLWNHDPTYHSAGSTGDRTDSYANVPLLHSTNGYTLFFNSTYNAEADIGYTEPDAYSFDFNGDILDLYIWNGTPEENISDYTSVTGKPFIPPEWAFGYWAGSGSVLYRDADNNNLDAQAVAEKVSGIIESYKAMGVKPAAYYGEGAYIDNISDVLPILCENGIAPLSWNRCSTAYSNIIKKLASLVSITRLPLIRRTDDTYKYFGNEAMTYIDYSNPLSVELVKRLYADKTSAGLRGVMIDMGEYIGEHTSFYNGKNGDEMHNLYSYYYAKSVNEAFSELTNDDFVLFERSGCAGSQRYAILFGGDQAAKWYGLRQQVNAMLTSAASGYAVYGGDIGGLHGRPTDELYTRWVQFSTFTPVMREHGNTSDDMLPWTYSEAAQESFKKHYEIREVLKSHIYSTALKSGETGIPMVKSLAFAYPEQPSVYGVEDEYIFCDSLLVAPVLSVGATSRNITLPSGKWYDLYTGETLTGGSTFTASAGFDTIPVYAASGAVIPLNLSKSLDIYSSGDRRSVLLTPPESDAFSEIKSDNGDVSYTLKSLGSGSFKMTRSADDDRDTLIIYGMNASSVSAEGVELKKESSGAEVGFFYKGNNTVIVLPDGCNDVEIYAEGVLKQSNIIEVKPENEAELDSFTCYSVPGNSIIESLDENGISKFKEVKASDIWNVPASGVIERQSTAEYTSTGSRKGASALYLPGNYTDFELSFSYCYNSAASWRWMSVGFGAENIGDNYYNSGYLAMIEQEGTVKLLGDKKTSGISTYHVSDTVIDGYPSQDKWYNFVLRVQGDTMTVSFDKYSYEYTLPSYDSGAVYLHCFSNNMRFKDIKLVDLADVYTVNEKDRYSVSAAKSKAEVNISDSSVFAGEKVNFTLTLPENYILSAQSVIAYWHDGKEMKTLSLEADQNGVYSFEMPSYPVSLGYNCYLPCDANSDGKLNILDLIRIKKHLAKSNVLLDSTASDIDLNGIIDAVDLSKLRLKLFE